MDILIEASPYLDTKGSERAKTDLYNQSFEYSKIANKIGERPEKMMGFWESDNGFADRLAAWNDEEKRVLFLGWTCKDMFHYQEITYKNKIDNIIITFEPFVYEINNSGRKFLFPALPDTIDDFINDLKRIGIRLFWKEEIADIYGIDNITGNKKIIDYYTHIRQQKKGSSDGSSS